MKSLKPTKDSLSAAPRLTAGFGWRKTIDIIVLEARYHCILGNVASATAFDFPVRYQRIKGSSTDGLLYKQDPEFSSPFIEAAQALECDGVRAITGACGFMALFSAGGQRQC